MKGIDYRFIGACGLYCGECDVYLAFINNNQKLKEEIARDHNIESSYVHCDGCWGDFSKIWGIEWQEGGKTCKIRKCAERHHIHICIDCPEFSCQMLGEFHKKGYQKARKNLFRMREIGVEKWLEEKQKNHAKGI